MSDSMVKEYKNLYENAMRLMALQAQKIEELEKEIDNLKEENNYLKRKMFGKSSETSAALGMGQLSLFDEAEAETKPEEEQYTIEEVSFKRKKYKGQRDDKLSKLPHTKVVLTLPESELVCPECGTEMKAVGEEFVRHEIEFIPARLRVKDIYTMTYECRRCRKNGRSVMLTAGTPEPVIAHSYASAESVAHVMKEKYVNGVPLYRQEAEWKRLGLDLSRATMANWIIYTAEHWLRPIVDRMHDELVRGNHVHADETPVQVLNEPGKKATSKSYMWVYSNIKESEHPIRIFDYKPDRKGDNPRMFLKGFRGTVITDAYSGYNNLEGCINAYCWAHARRKFVDSIPNGVENIKDTLPGTAISKIKKLFLIEKKIEGMSAEERVKTRKKKSEPLVNDFFSWCETNAHRASSNKLTAAFNYVLNHRDGLCAYLDDGNIPMTNSLDERTIRPFTTGRKNWLFSTSVDGAESSACAYSIIESAKANNLDPYKYLVNIFKYLPSQDIFNDSEIIDEFLPWSDFMQRECKK